MTTPSSIALWLEKLKKNNKPKTDFFFLIFSYTVILYQFLYIKTSIFFLIFLVFLCSDLSSITFFCCCSLFLRFLIFIKIDFLFLQVFLFDFFLFYILLNSFFNLKSKYSWNVLLSWKNGANIRICLLLWLVLP